VAFELKADLIADACLSSVSCARATNPMLGFKVFERGAVTIAGVELLHRVRKGQFNLGRLHVRGQAAPAIWNAVLSA